MSSLHTCASCKIYTLEKRCGVCKEKTKSAHYIFSHIPDAVQKQFKKR